MTKWIRVDPPYADVTSDVLNELTEAIRNHSSFNSLHEGFAILKVEVDELWDEVKRNDPTRARKEAVQVAAMAVRFLIDCPA